MKMTKRQLAEFIAKKEISWLGLSGSLKNYPVMLEKSLFVAGEILEETE